MAGHSRPMVPQSAAVLLWCLCVLIVPAFCSEGDRATDFQSCVHTCTHTGRIAVVDGAGGGAALACQRGAASLPWTLQ